MLRNILLMLLCTVLSITAVTSAQAQGTAIVGRVTDTSDNPLVGVTVMIKGSTAGTATDAKGNYSINASPAQTIVFSYLGYTTANEVVGKRTAINVKMNEEAESIGSVEVVSVGYGTVSRRDLTGSVAKADLSSIMKSNVTSFDQALSGRIAGVVVTTGDGALGQDANITIRGNNSITQSNAPLYIIDGFPMESSFANSIAPQDIESIDILKDASATAIYGARGANGVIVITTKQGKEGKPTVNVSAAFTMSQIANKADLMDPYDFVKLQLDIDPKATNPYLKERTLEDYRSYNLAAKGITGYDWQDEIYRQALTQNYNASVSGGTAGTKYNIGFSALNQDGILLKSNFQRYQGKANITQQITKKLSFTLGANYSRSVTNGVTPTDPQAGSSSSGWLIYSIWGYRPVAPFGSNNMYDAPNDEGVGGSDDYRFNPVLTAKNEYRKTIFDYLNGNGAFDYKINDAFKLRISGGYTYSERRREEFNGLDTYTGYPNSPGGKGINGIINWTQQTTWLNENTLTYNKRFGKSHNFNAMVGFTMQGQSTQFNGVSATRIEAEGMGLNGIFSGNQQTVVPYTYNWRMMSFLARVNYNYKYKYYLTASFRADGSSKFPENNRFGYFPSVGVSWNFNREDFLKNEKWLSNGKLRASWGQTGNNRTQTPYDYLPEFTTRPGSNNTIDYVFGAERVPGFANRNLRNDELKWETTTQTNVGVDLGLFQERVKVTADWYLKDTKDLLLYAQLPPSTGYQNAMMNIGQIRNQGWELSLETVNIRTRQFTWTSSFNIAFNKNKIMSLYANQPSLQSTVSWDGKYNTQIPYISAVGAPAGLMFGYIYEGTYKPEDFSNGLLKEEIPYMGSAGRAKIQAGDPRYRDMNGDGVIDDYDRTVIGCGQPIHTGGFGNTLNYKNFDLNIFFAWSYGNDILNANRLIFESGIRANTNQLKSFVNRWSPDNPRSNIPRWGSTGAEVYSSRVVEDGSFLRLKNVSLGYTIPPRLLRKASISSLRVYVTADNIYTFTGYSGPDPEVSTRKSVLTPGFDWSAYPRSLGITAGVNITF